MSPNPYWYIVAKSFEGAFHSKGGNPNPALKEFVHLVDDSAHLSDENWGSAFVGSCLALAGFHSSHSLNPSSYAYFGRKITTPLKGCVVLFNPMPEPHRAGHVAFFEAIEGDKIIVFGGNEPLMAGTNQFPLSKVKGYFYPNAVNVLPEPRPEHLRTIDNITDDLPPHLLEDLIDNTQIQFTSPLTYQGEYGGNDVDNKELWSLISGDGLPKPIAELVYNTAQKLGHHRAGLLLQQSLTHQGYNLLQDGNINQYSLLACQRVNIEQLTADYMDLSRKNYLKFLEAKAVDLPIEPLSQNLTIPSEQLSQSQLESIIINTINANMPPKAIEPAIIQPTSALGLTTIDKIFGGEYLKGKKSMLAVVLLVANELLALFEVYPSNGLIYSAIAYLAGGFLTIGLLSKLDRAIASRKNN